jgi:hypothetical protein
MALQDAERPPRSTSIAAGFVVLLAVVFVLVRRPKPSQSPPAPPPSANSAAVVNPYAADQLASAMAELEKLPLGTEGQPLARIQQALEGAGNADKGFRLPDGREPPPLPSDAPRAVRIGVVLVRYQGAQLAPADAPPREAALTRARTLLTLARTDFAAAVKAGDFGSSVDVGRVERGLLEPGTQHVCFTLPAGSVSELLDTPRGFWIVHRIR